MSSDDLFQSRMQSDQARHTPQGDGEGRILIDGAAPYRGEDIHGSAAGPRYQEMPCYVETLPERFLIHPG